jgi:hypothetical protein
MGWCSATSIMDAAVAAADKLVLGTYEALGVDPDRVTVEDIQPQLDELMKPYVRSIARQLHEGDWDCIEESDYFSRFPQEMLDHDDQEHERWLREQLEEGVADRVPEDILTLAQQLKAHTDKMEAGNG